MRLPIFNDCVIPAHNKRSSTDRFPASAELAALIGKLPTPEEYQTYVAQVDKTAVDTYRYLNFDQLSQYTEKADGVIFQTAV
ncbi:hypothetical protein FYT70_07190 [Salmonella enterica subsp. enterica]|uniref:Aconitate hydratase n=1 Tax=Salmonella enterica I TaxID=59201 RepID=A0A379V1M0_SALET|nr:hypothetical protein [Salmonella enterica]EAB6709796.1 hypothetical protein [Salmonella enterica subsp. enterica serovar Tokoin]EBF8130758.1 hypothetical protein [Salmonella enterica subsp. enterica]EBS2257203.1 hypothetical protein [Salmonella enterica subsp. enterica serovar Kirkee]EBV1890094.1 hypothetical protein [Salmonella enterica subsp. enterica serovar Coquilhatville]EBX1508259.1 hypothetical protein [Salmonella enterica subsp. enterica serovar Stanley]ECW7107765.1 hypothetical pr